MFNLSSKICRICTQTVFVVFLRPTIEAPKTNLKSCKSRKSSFLRNLKLFVILVTQRADLFFQPTDCQLCWTVFLILCRIHTKSSDVKCRQEKGCLHAFTSVRYSSHFLPRILSLHPLPVLLTHIPSADRRRRKEMTVKTRNF